MRGKTFKSKIFRVKYKTYYSIVWILELIRLIITGGQNNET